CERGLWLDQGIIAHAGTISDCLTQYNNSGESGVVKFEPLPDKPSIKSLEIDQEALKQGHLRIAVGFRSPNPFKPNLGIVLYNKFGQPVFGSNTRMTGATWSPIPMTSGVITCWRDDAPLCNDMYKLSVWLGDAHSDYDMRLDALFFEFAI